MKRLLLVLLVSCFSFGLFAQEASEAPAKKIPSVVIAPDVFGALVLGLYNAKVNVRLTDNITLDTDGFYFNIRNNFLMSLLVPEEAGFWVGGLKIGPTWYLKKSFDGLFVGAYAKGVGFNMTTETENFSAMAFGAGAKAGWTGTWDWFSLSISGGYEFNMATVDTSVLQMTVGDFLSGFVQGGLPVFAVEMGIALY